MSPLKRHRSVPAGGRSVCLLLKIVLVAASAAASATAIASAAPRATASTATTAGTATKAAATARAATAAESARALFARPSFVDNDGSAFKVLAVHAADGRLRFRVAAHLDKAEALGAAGITVHHYLGRADSTKLRKGLLQTFVTHCVCEVTDVEFVAHGRRLSFPE